MTARTKTRPRTRTSEATAGGSVLASVGTALPDGVLTNADFEKMMDTDDEWIRSRTGIAERRVGGTTTGLAIEAATEAVERADVDRDEIDLVIVATQTPDDLCPSTAAGVQHALGLTCAAFDVNAACAGFTYGLVTAHSMLGIGYRAAVVVGVDRMTAATNYDDRSTAILFGDGAGAVVLTAADGNTRGGSAADRGVLAWDTGTDGGHADILKSPITDGRITGVEMEGKAVFKLMVRYAVESARQALDRAGLHPDDVAAVLAHQANQRILDAVSARLDIKPDKVVSIIERVGNTSAASVPLALDAAVANGMVTPGDPVLLMGFGGGLSWATTVAIWQ
jgi:3-oxoacyl-[acyl-carrier-protein] synthase-3